MTTLLGLQLAGRRVLVVGGGPIAARRTIRFLADGGDVVVVAPAVCPDLADLVAAGSVRWLQREAVAADLDGAWLVHTATGDRSTDAAVARWAQERRIWCVAAGHAPTGSARMPATATAAGMAIAVISTGPPDPVRVARIRDDLAAHVDAGDIDLRTPRQSGRVTLVGGGPGAPDLITVRGMQALRSADVVVTDRLGPTGLLASLPSDVEVIDVGKTPGHHPVPQREINSLLVSHAKRGRAVVRLKGGDPFLLGRGGEEVLACHEAGVPVEVIPGVSSALAAPAAAGIPVTQRGISTALHVITGHEGLTPAAAAGLQHGTATVVILMGVAMLPQLVAQALAAGIDPDTPLAVVERGWLPGQRVIRGTLAAASQLAADHEVRAPAVIVIGGVAALDLTAAESLA